MESHQLCIAAIQSFPTIPLLDGSPLVPRFAEEEALTNRLQQILQPCFLRVAYVVAPPIHVLFSTTILCNNSPLSSVKMVASSSQSVKPFPAFQRFSNSMGRMSESFGLPYPFLKPYFCRIPVTCLDSHQQVQYCFHIIIFLIPGFCLLMLP